jgi:AbiV family abortive infection protein
MLCDCAISIEEGFPVIASFLAILAIEEIGKGLAFIESYEKNNDLTEKDWKKLTAGSSAHKNKLKRVHKALVDPYSMLKPHELSAKLGELKEAQHDLSKIAKEMHDLKLNYLYVNWNDKEGQWDSPANWGEEEKKWIYRKGTLEKPIIQRLISAIGLLSKKLRET